ncbi:type II toxin-antitoxin system RelE/ParE family toxin [Candidatus Gottesmanbacteria bacterium]|nr:type II toxin-antitoxin system RelE/ParE family toxin [Candidatus Gottesmanbacteria bacterium]
MYKILIEKKAAKFLSKLDSKSYHLISRAIKNLSYLREQKNLDIKSLKGKFKNMMRLRVGSRRILFTIDEEQKEIRIWIIENRGDVY